MANENKVLVLGLDGMEPDTTKRMVEAGRMPNVKKLIELGAAVPIWNCWVRCLPLRQLSGPHWLVGVILLPMA